MWAWDSFFSPMVDKSALKINVSWGWGLVLGAKCISVWTAKMIVFSKLSCTSRPITDHLPYLSYSWTCDGKDCVERPSDASLYKAFQPEATWVGDETPFAW